MPASSPRSALPEASVSTVPRLSRPAQPQPGPHVSPAPDPPGSACLLSPLARRPASLSCSTLSTAAPALPSVISPGELAPLQVSTSSMALVVMCGQPCSGKSAAAACLAAALHSSSPDLTVRIIDESSLHLGCNDSYKDMVVEKNLRGVLRSEVDRSLSRNGIIIVDSLNNIKGYRYELWCLARASGVRYCVLFCNTEVDHCKEWNSNRQEKGEPPYDSNIFEDLVRRFEKPDRRNRWDSPLFELFPSRDEIVETAPVIVEAVSYLTKKVDSKTRDVKVLQPTIATQTVRTTEANSLYEMDKATQEVVNAIVEAQSCGLGLAVNRISIGPNLPSINLQRSVGLPELRSLRRTFIKLAGQYCNTRPRA